MSTNNLYNTRQITKYTHTTRVNFIDWKRDIDALLSAHPDKLLTIVQDNALSIATKIKLKSQYKSLGEEWTGATEKEHIIELDTTAYHLILPTIGDDTFRKRIERLHGNNYDASGAYNTICEEWALGTGCGCGRRPPENRRNVPSENARAVFYAVFCIE